MVGNGKKKLSNNTEEQKKVCTGTFGQKLIMFSAMGWRAGLHDRILTRFLSIFLLFPKAFECGGEQRMDPMGLLHLNSYTVRLGPLSVTAQCPLIVHM